MHRPVARQAGTGVDDAQVRGPRIRGDRHRAQLLGRKRARMRVSGVEETSNRRVIKMKSNRTVSQMKDSSPIDDRMLDAMIGQIRPRIARAMKILRRSEVPTPSARSALRWRRIQFLFSCRVIA